VEREPTTARAEAYFDSHAGSYDRAMGFFERHVLGQHRGWATSHACGEVLELAVGTGLNLGLYPPVVSRVVGVELSAQMLARAQAPDRCRAVGRPQRSTRRRHRPGPVTQAQVAHRMPHADRAKHPPLWRATLLSAQRITSSGSGRNGGRPLRRGDAGPSAQDADEERKC
jgi:hypothetical protein